MPARSGVAENLPYSFSRWTDVPAAKWPWFLERLKAGSFGGIDPRTGIPSTWSLLPEDTLGLTFWTKDPSNLLRAAHALRHYDNVDVHVTLTGWEEVEKGAPTLEEGGELLVETAAAFPRTHWRFSPVPLLEHGEVVRRFGLILEYAEVARLREVYLSFLQTNDRMTEARERDERLALMVEMAELAKGYGVRVLLCNEDRTLARVAELPDNLGSGVCARPEWFGMEGHDVPASEGCGCALAVDPFTINESCTLGCTYCYAADKSLSEKKRNTTRRLPTL